MWDLKLPPSHKLKLPDGNYPICLTINIEASELLRFFQNIISI
jgi:hypothetical protein